MSENLKGALAFAGVLILGVLFLLGFLLFALVLIALAFVTFLGFYIYLRLKLWWAKRHSPKELEGPEDYF
ncbi:hypothetical protein [Thermococcus sp.]